MTQLLTPPVARRATNPLHPDRVLRSAVELGRETLQAIADDPRDFDRGLALIETAVARFRSAFLAQPFAAADHALAYHDRSKEDLDADFSPLYYRRAVLENVLTRYDRAAQDLLRQWA
jgi:hypothetical protein